MEMPEGWKNLYEVTQTAVVEAHNASDDEQARFATQILRHIYLEPLNLMKEMAEALERVSNLEMLLSPIPGAARAGAALDTHTQLILQKFRKWK